MTDSREVILGTRFFVAIMPAAERAFGATAGTALRSDMKDFGPSCFHSASTGGTNANAAPEGGV